MKKLLNCFKSAQDLNDKPCFIYLNKKSGPAEKAAGEDKEKKEVGRLEYETSPKWQEVKKKYAVYVSKRDELGSLLDRYSGVKEFAPIVDSARSESDKIDGKINAKRNKYYQVELPAKKMDEYIGSMNKILEKFPVSVFEQIKAAKENAMAAYQARFEVLQGDLGNAIDAAKERYKDNPNTYAALQRKAGEAKRKLNFMYMEGAKKGNEYWNEFLAKRDENLESAAAFAVTNFNNMIDDAWGEKPGSFGVEGDALIEGFNVDVDAAHMLAWGKDKKGAAEYLTKQYEALKRDLHSLAVTESMQTDAFLTGHEDGVNAIKRSREAWVKQRTEFLVKLAEQQVGPSIDAYDNTAKLYSDAEGANLRTLDFAAALAKIDTFRLRFSELNEGRVTSLSGSYVAAAESAIRANRRFDEKLEGRWANLQPAPEEYYQVAGGGEKVRYRMREGTVLYCGDMDSAAFGKRAGTINGGATVEISSNAQMVPGLGLYVLVREIGRDGSNKRQGWVSVNSLGKAPIPKEGEIEKLA